jgi:hypothetical protein
MDKIIHLNIEQKTPNYHSLKNGKKNIKIKLNNVLCPFGIDEEYGNHLFKFEIDKNNDEHIELIKEIVEFESKLKLQFNSTDDEWKSLIYTRENDNMFLDSKVKKIKTNIVTKVKFDDNDNNYLRTIYELKQPFKCNVTLEIPTIWDYRIKNDEKKENKIGFILNIVNMYVY